jgi:hypothetical protein
MGTIPRRTPIGCEGGHSCVCGLSANWRHRIEPCFESFKTRVCVVLPDTSCLKCLGERWDFMGESHLGNLPNLWMPIIHVYIQNS